ncbi:methionine ABC transporter permease [Sediminivirga luteola]|uniref:ABC transporter permease n=1 Tax=Sediminivirga luteola TaxID=1774748 RepID=A0A8J2TZ43_9MICO|nr:ABC transporter permease subunit [Sediminivirga luteola]MCI2265564.1 ABC transporter permease subunit [Sediminivirga luteola]GGA18735.1 ABC transporter permease [Sediminivirga luteola]
MREINLEAFLPRLGDAVFETLLMVSVSFVLASVLGVLLGLLLYATRPGNLLQNRPVFAVLNLLINIIRPIPFLIIAVSIIPLTRAIVGTSIGPVAAIIPLTLVATVAVARIAESNLVAVDPGTIEAGAAMGASPVRVLFTIVIPEALGPLTLGLTYILVALVDSTAVAGVIGGGGLGDLAMRYGYQRFDWFVVGVIVVILIVLVQVAQWLGNVIARKVMH